MTEARLKRALLYAAASAAAAATLYITLRYLLWWLLPFLIAGAIAVAMEPTVRALQKKLRLQRGFASLVLTLFLLFVLGGLLSLLVTTLTGEADMLLRHIPTLLEAVPETMYAFLDRLEQYGALCPPWLKETLTETVTRSVSGAGDLLSRLSELLLASLGSFAAAVPQIILASATCVLAIYFTSSSLPEFCLFFSKHLPVEAQRRFRRMQNGFTRSLARWLHAELTLCCVTFTELLGVFWFLRQPYAVLLAFLITLVDALPVFGTGTVLIPWAIANILLQNTPKAICLILLYLITLTVRSFLEPRLLGKLSGVPPLLSLMAMYLGFCSFGVTGMILFPFLLLLTMQLRRS